MEQTKKLDHRLRGDAPKPRDFLKRRDFLKSSASAALGVGILGQAPPALSAPPPGPPRVRAYKKLGRTGLEISDISFGSSRTSDPAVARHALDLGVNYFDTADSYKGGASERALGEALVGRRSDVFLASKVQASARSSVADLTKALDASLSRLRTDHIDVYFNHAVNDVKRLQNDAWGEFTKRAKEAGKIRFTGMSGHGGQLASCLEYALQHDLVDVILCAYNFGQDPAFYQRFVSRLDFVAVQPELPRLLAKAKEKNVGVIAMKTLRGARMNDMRPYETGGATFAQAAFRWTLSDPNVDALIVSMTDDEQIDEYLGASGAASRSGAEIDLLEQYLLTHTDGYCEHGCQTCQASCPNEVQVSEVLRTRMYARDVGDLAYARSEFSALQGDARACLDCSGAPCAGVCPTGLDISRLTRDAQNLLA